MRYDLIVISMLCWGLAVFLPKLAGRDLSPAGVVLANAIGYLVCLPVVLRLLEPRDLRWRADHGWGILIGVLFVIGNLAYYRALQIGSVSRLAPLTALYVAIPVILGVFVLRERPSAAQAVGIVLAVVAAFLLSLEPAPTPGPS